MTTKKPNPQDSTLRNVRAAQRKLVDLEARITTLEETMHAVQTQLALLALPLPIDAPPPAQ
jgi:hypothetical protein